MGFFDGLAKGIGQLIGSGEQQNSIVELATGLLSGSGSEGLSGLADRFKSNGLGDVISSWIGTGQNQPISAEQIQAVMGNEKIQQFAEKLGLSSEDISSGLAAVLPRIIDSLTPDGNVPDQGALDQQLAALKDKLMNG